LGVLYNDNVYIVSFVYLLMYKDIEYRKKMVRKFIIKNPNTTHEEIKKKLHTKIERLYEGRMEEAFRDAGVKSPRTLRKKSAKENRKIIIDLIRKNPGIGGRDISIKTGINVCSVFDGIQKAYGAAGIDYPRKKSYDRTPDEKREEIISLIKKNPLISTNEIIEKSGTLPHRLFKNIGEVYRAAGIKKIPGQIKRTLNIRNRIVKYIVERPLATQREINVACKTHVQEIFKGGIFEAYKLAKVKFPYERLKLYGVGLKEIRKRAKDFEDEIAVKLSGFGLVNRLVRIKRGVADIVFERKNKKVIIEVKDYCAKDISCGQINQLKKYLEDFDCDMGFLICHKKPKKNKFLIGKSKIYVLEDSELKEIPKIMGL